MTDADPLLALGVTPVALASYAFYEDTGGLGPWARDLGRGEAPQVLTEPFAIERLVPQLAQKLGG